MPDARAEGLVTGDGVSECAFPSCECPGDKPICADYVCAGCILGSHCNGFDRSCSCPKHPRGYCDAP